MEVNFVNYGRLIMYTKEEVSRENASSLFETTSCSFDSAFLMAVLVQGRVAAVADTVVWIVVRDRGGVGGG